ncbi:Spt4/RpoE2 zinc finger protein [Oxytricha trifallax]|uniref:Spt4/RpoE2 zinc finger protein n=1 Tax=Oxytricha trifallax TaxID=1172189 RepID=A0A073HZT0_9SPIT|nr:Spt4/RpoE2 zinc finger protein [Oxytricha trifallax]
MNQLVNAKLPNSLKKLRACLDCHFIRNDHQFLEDGCMNCKAQDYDNEVMAERTSANYQGIICVMQNKESWVSRFNNLQNKVPGAYALCMSADIKLINPKIEEAQYEYSDSEEDERLYNKNKKNGQDKHSNGHKNGNGLDLSKKIKVESQNRVLIKKRESSDDEV